MNAKLKLASAVILSSFLAACGSTPRAPVEPIQIASQEKSFKISNEFGEVPYREVIAALSKSIHDHSVYQSWDLKQLSTGEQSSWYKKGLQGRQIANEGLSIRYTNTVLNEGREFSSYHQANFGVRLFPEDSYQRVVITTPTEVTRHDRSVLFGMMTVDQLDTTENIVSDLLKVASQIDIEIHREMSFSGELASEYSIDAVIHGINRSYAVQQNSRSNSQVRSFHFTVDGTRVEAKLTPFRNGSMLDYSFKLPYSLSSDGTTSHSKTELISASEGIISKITSII